MEWQNYPEFILGLAYVIMADRPRFLAVPPLTLNLPLMASKETLEQVKNLLKQELSSINAKLDVIFFFS